MSQDEFLTYIPLEIIIDILSRLPVKSIITCKCVCKSWLDLLNSPEFSKSHLSKSKSGLVVYSSERHSELLKIFEYVDSLDNLESHQLHYNPVTKFDRRAFISHLHATVGIQGSTNGLLFLWDFAQPNALYICNPITRDYIELPSPEGNAYRYPDIVTYGFGVSKMSGKHKVVRIFHKCIRDDETYRLISIPKSICQVYTLGTGSWRSVAPGAPMEYSCRSIGAFLNGNLHWLVTDLKGCYWISCFDLQTELFSTFSPPFGLQWNGSSLCGLVALGDFLCLSYHNSSEDKLVIWLMKDYGVERSWTKQFVISKFSGCPGESYDVIYPIKVFKDGDILMASQESNSNLFYYSNKTKSISMFDMFELQNHEGMPYTPSLLSLKSFLMENAKSF